MTKGTIVLDVDGTVASSWGCISPVVVQRLHQLSDEGWQMAFITGRMCASVLPTLSCMDFPYILGVQNGAVLMRYPSEEVVDVCGISRELFSALDAMCEGCPTDYALYCGAHCGDLVYYRPDRYSARLLEHVQQRMKSCGEEWVPVENYDNLEFETVGSIKFLGSKEMLDPIGRRAEEELNLHIPVIRDPVADDYWVAQGTHPDAHKGAALRRIPGIDQGLVIAAGNDGNDVTLLEAADIGIAMPSAPGELLAVADYVAPPVEEDGLLNGLDWAINQGRR